MLQQCNNVYIAYILPIEVTNNMTVTLLKTKKVTRAKCKLSTEYI